MNALTVPPPLRPRGVAAALLLSLLAHGALLWLAKPGSRPDDVAGPPLRIQLNPPAPAIIPPPARAVAPASPARKPAAPPRRPSAATRADAADRGERSAPAGPTLNRRDASAPGPALTLGGLRRQLREQAAAAPEKLSPLPADPAKTKLARSIERAEKPDCKTRYSSFGLLAIPILAVQSAREDGCKW
ncbi:type IV secretory pathway VirB10-like protein [Chromobacterium alkanivorans]|uniref:hypothetical protein n=1 Tax=Chromobacterium alkanivorans TaxID=1071719 RepID=UPI00216A145D|nr:hypothetical protein [Chromobacterium alkanivorans]MCS3805245.1 type IV secretory pathway VirB10-like protein [Chromobacterium alkanivorans]MCS3819584.1 type IV secretory pathway VirB10-like protein [Chromobacterium alkanivorans]MCS3874441.1 type IV secretory pathway VirB10-like protein [Chromobacterium alkanivorans]